MGVSWSEISVTASNCCKACFGRPLFFYNLLKEMIGQLCKKSSSAVRGGTYVGIRIKTFMILQSLPDKHLVKNVEAAGVEPASKQGARMLSTRLFCD